MKIHYSLGLSLSPPNFVNIVRNGTILVTRNICTRLKLAYVGQLRNIRTSNFVWSRAENCGQKVIAFNQLSWSTDLLILAETRFLFLSNLRISPESNGSSGLKDLFRFEWITSRLMKLRISLLLLQMFHIFFSFSILSKNSTQRWNFMQNRRKRLSF